MKTLITTLPAVLLGTTAALAATSISEIDMDNDDFASFEELSAVYSGLSMEEFEQIDVNDDNRVSSDELYAPDAQQIVSLYEGSEMPSFVIDLNGDGFSEYEEITTVFTELSPEEFELMDTNDDNRLSQVEVNDIEAQNILNEYRSTEDVATIAAADVDQDGFLNSSEMMAAYPGLTAIEFDEIDENNDNRVSYSELYTNDAQDIVSRYEG